MLTHKGTKTLETDRLILRQFTMDDAEPMFRNWASDDTVTKHMTWPTHSSMEVTEMVLSDWTKSYRKPDYYQWAIVFEGEPIGSISVVSHNDRVEKAEIGYCMGRKWWHRGIKTQVYTCHKLVQWVLNAKMGTLPLL